jgi:predicted AAA+ superfamily ATPase
VVRATPAGTTIFVDEAQAVPSVFDAVQHLYDRDRERWRFVLCGSSARRLRQSGANLLPGRSLLHHIYPLILPERPAPASLPVSGPVPLPGAPLSPTFPAASIEERLAFGELPGVATADPGVRAALLRSYATIYLEEEIRREAHVRDWGAFLRFLRLAAAEAGGEINYAAISRDAGVSQPTVKSHYQLLEDMFVGFSLPAWSGSPRRSLLSTPKFYFFDVGVRHAAAGLTPSYDTVAADPGPIFEQWVATELWKRARYLGARLFHLRARGGAEVDFVLELGEGLIPIEVKWTDRPDRPDGRHLRSFLAENPGRSEMGWIVCRCPRPMQMDEQVRAIPWWAI